MSTCLINFGLVRITSKFDYAEAEDVSLTRNLTY